MITIDIDWWPIFFVCVFSFCGCSPLVRGWIDFDRPFGMTILIDFPFCLSLFDFLGGWTTNRQEAEALYLQCLDIRARAVEDEDVNADVMTLTLKSNLADLSLKMGLFTFAQEQGVWVKASHSHSWLVIHVIYRCIELIWIRFQTHLGWLPAPFFKGANATSQLAN